MVKKDVILTSVSLNKSNARISIDVKKSTDKNVTRRSKMAMISEKRSNSMSKRSSNLNNTSQNESMQLQPKNNVERFNI